MSENRFLFWQRWLTYANVMTVGVGLLVAFAGNSFFFALHNAYSQDIFFGGQAFSTAALQFKNFLFGIIGGTIVGFHVLMVFISENAFKRRERWAWQASWAGLLSWFCIDSSLSLFHGAWYNVVLINIVALVLIGLPLVMTRKAFNS